MKIITIFIFVLFFCASVFAVPQVFTTDVTVDITNATLRISGENFNSTETLSIINNSIVDFSKKFTFLLARDFVEGKDTGTILEGFIKTLNFSEKWIECVNINSAMNNNLSKCEMNCENRVNSCNNDLNVKNVELGNKNSELDNIKSQRIIYAIVGAGAVFLILTLAGKGLKRNPKKEEEGQFPERDRV